MAPSQYGWRALRFSEKPPLDLIAVDRPTSIRLFFPSVEFEVRSWTNSLDQFAKQEGLPAVCRPSGRLPTSARPIPKGQIPADTQQQKLVGDSPIVPHAELWLDPD